MLLFYADLYFTPEDNCRIKKSHYNMTHLHWEVRCNLRGFAA